MYVLFMFYFCMCGLCVLIGMWTHVGVMCIYVCVAMCSHVKFQDDFKSLPLRPGSGGTRL